MTNRLAHHFHFDESTVIVRAIRSDYDFYSNFQFSNSKDLQLHILGYTVCVCLIDGVPGFNEFRFVKPLCHLLSKAGPKVINLSCLVFTSLYNMSFKLQVNHIRRL